MFQGTSIKRIRRTAIAGLSVLTLGTGAAVWATTAASAAPSPAAVPGCATSALSVWVDATQSDGGAGTVAYPLEITNRGGHACTLKGYPGVSATTFGGRQLGDAAGHDPVFKAGLVTIPAGGTAHADLFYHDVEVSTSGCKPAAASLIKVYPPNSRTAKTGFFSLPVCTVKKHGSVSVSVVRGGSRLDV
ncbi:MAG TPA: DUF4232 domain-containing protein [Trebonia sp.]